MEKGIFQVNKTMQYAFIMVLVGAFIGFIIFSKLPNLFVLLPILKNEYGTGSWQGSHYFT